MTVGVVIAIVVLVGVIGFGIWSLKNGIQSPEESSKSQSVYSGKLPSQAPTEEELLLAMSNTELLREIVRNQRQMLVVMKSTNRRSGLGLLGFLNVFRLLSDDSE